MYLNGFQCDNCEKIHNTDIVQYRDLTPKLPEGWHHVQEQDKPARHFCSVNCMYQWSSNEVSKQEKQWKYTEG